jgi:CubicO group peptidase (beta-lactamase class C family)
VPAADEPVALPTARAILARGIADGLHPGAQLHVRLRGETVVDLALGEASPGVPMRTDTLLVWLSSGKPVTAIAIAQLWERGRLELDDPIAHHLPEFAAGGKEAITLRHALTHTGGFRMLDVGWPRASWEETIARICAARREPRWVPGEKAGYHQASSWFVLGEVVRRVDGRPFPDYVREEIFLPLGMVDSWIGMPAERYRAYRDGGRLAAYWDTDSPRRRHPWDEEAAVVRPSPGGNAWGPLRDLARLWTALLAGGTLDGRRILAPQTVEALLARHRTGMLDHTFRRPMDWGLGVIPNSRPGLAENWAAWQTARSEGATGDQRSTPSSPALPYHYGPHASRRAVGHSGYRSSTAFCDPTHGLVVAAGVTGTPADEAHGRRFEELTTAIYDDLGLV